MIKILAVDDEEHLCKFVGSFFRKRGYTVLTAFSAEEALAVIEKEKPQVILLDIMMPKVSGLEVLKQVRKKYPSEKVKVIIVTVLGDVAVREEAFSLGADEFIEKPYTTSYLEDVVMAKVEDLLGFSQEKEEATNG